MKSESLIEHLVSGREITWNSRRHEGLHISAPGQAIQDALAGSDERAAGIADA